MQEQLGISDEAGVSIKQVAQQAMNEDGQHFFEKFRQREEDVRIASLARWNAQLKGLAEFETRCQILMQEVKLLSERQDVLKGHGGRQNQVAEQSNGKVLRADLRGDEGSWKKTNQKRLCYLCKHTLWRYPNERDEAAKIWKLERERTFSPLSHAGHRRWIFFF